MCAARFKMAGLLEQQSPTFGARHARTGIGLAELRLQRAHRAVALVDFTGQRVYIGWVQFRGAWWAWFNDQWLGYIKDSVWISPTFTQTAQIQWYGEVASNNGIPPKTPMGNGEFPAKNSAASMTTLCDVDAKAWVCFYRDQQATGATHVSYYDIQNHTSFGAVRYGGPGQ